ncbi:hypothetical protein [Levilactobacillus fujinensis]
MAQNPVSRETVATNISAIAAVKLYVLAAYASWGPVMAVRA